MKKKRLIRIIPFLLLLLAGIGLHQIYLRYFHVTYQPEIYTQTSAHLSNPYRGWYRIYGYAPSDTQKVNTDIIPSVGQGADTPQLALIQINLRNYKNVEISSSGLTQIDDLFSAWAKTDKQLIVRFLYDWNGRAKETEPDTFEMVKTHMSQVAPIVNAHKDTIYLLQGIFVGNCGEMNNSNYLSKEQMYELIHHLADVTDPKLFLSVRTPAQWRITGQTYEPLPAQQAFGASTISRLGLFNDGMLGSGNDLGTYGDRSLSLATDFIDKGTRAEEIEFQNVLCNYVPNGGEVVLDNPHNDFEAAVTDLAHMHVSYLNCDYDRSALDKWQNAIYDGKDCFDGSNGYDYISEHLGYRYALTASSLAFDTWKDETATLSFSIENSGFSVSYLPFDSTILLENTADHSVIDLAITSDNRFWVSGETVRLSLPIDIRSLTLGTYKIYYRLRDPITGRTIQFANDSPLTENGYLLGTLTVDKRAE